MKKILVLFALVTMLGHTIVAQQNNKFTFHKEQSVKDFAMKGKTITAKGQLVAFAKGNNIVDYEIYYYIRQSSKIGEVILTKYMLTEPMFSKGAKKFLIAQIQEYYIAKELRENITITPVEGKDGYYLINAKNSNGIPFEETSINQAEKVRWGFGESTEYGVSLIAGETIEVGKFENKADFERFKKTLLTQ